MALTVGAAAGACEEVVTFASVEGGLDVAVLSEWSFGVRSSTDLSRVCWTTLLGALMLTAEQPISTPTLSNNRILLAIRDAIVRMLA